MEVRDNDREGWVQLTRQRSRINYVIIFMFAGICKHYYKAPSFFLQPLFPVIYSHPCFGWCTVCVELKLIWRWEHYQGQFIIRVGKTWTPYRMWSVFFLMEPWWSCYSTRWISLNTIRCCFWAQWGLMEHTQNINQRDICENSICSRSTSPFTPVLFHPWLSGASLSPLACPQPLLCWHRLCSEFEIHLHISKITQDF